MCLQFSCNKPVCFKITGTEVFTLVKFCWLEFTFDLTSLLKSVPETNQTGY